MGKSKTKQLYVDARKKLTEMLAPPSSPVIHLSANTMAKIKYLVTNADEEIAWWGVTSRDLEDETIFYIHDIIAPNNQAVDSTSCEWSNDEYGKAFDMLVQHESDPYDLDKNYPDMGKRGDWYMGHSHVNMGTSPTSTDMNQMLEAVEKHKMPYAIQTIHNKSGNIFIAIYDFENGIEYEEVSWCTESLLDYDEIAQLDAAINSTKPIVHESIVHPTHQPYWSRNQKIVQAQQDLSRDDLQNLCDQHGIQCSDNDTVEDLKSVLDTFNIPTTRYPHE